jgi:hypothetical protein
MVNSAPTAAATRYDAFLSYTHRDTAVAVAVQTQVERLAKPWWRRRQLHVFRDESALPASAALWSSLVSALSQSRYLIVLASVAAARSEWTDREVAWWLDHRSADRLILAVVDGDLSWDDRANRFDPGRTTCLPPSLLERTEQEPHWVDLRSVSVEQGLEQLVPPAAAVVAALTGKEKDEILGEDLRQHRRTRRTAVAALAVISVLAAAAVVAAVVATAQRDAARRSATIAQARALAAGAQANLGQDLDRSLLYAATAYRQHDDTASHAALFQALSSNPHLMRFIPHSAPPTALTWLGTTHVLAEGGPGYLVLTDVDSGSSRTVRLSGTVTALAGTADGGTVVTATSEQQLTAIDAQSGRMRWTVSSTSASSAVSLATDAASGLVAELDENGAVTIRRLADGGSVGTGTPPLAGPYPAALSFVSFLNGGSRLAVGDVEGEVEVLGLPDLSVLSPWSPPLGPGDFLPPSAYVGDDSSVAFVLGGRDVSVATVVGQRTIPRFPDTNVQDMSAVAVSDSLDEVAFDGDGQLEIAQPPDEWHPDGVITALRGVSSTNSRLSFSADGSLLAGTTGEMTAVWAPRSVSGAVRVLPDPLLSLCFACSGAPAALDVHDSTVIWKAMQPDYTEHLLCASTRSGEVLGDVALPAQTYVQAVAVRADGSTMLAADDTDGVLAWTLADGCPSGPARSFATGALGGDTSVGVLVLGDGSTLIVGQNQSVAWVDQAGSVRQQSPPAPPTDVYVPPPAMAAAPDGSHFALGRHDGSVTTYRAAGTAVTRVWEVDMGEPVLGVAYVSASRMAVSTASGNVVVLRTASGAVVHRLTGAQGFTVAGAQGLVVGVGGQQDRAAIWSASDGRLLATFTFVPFALPPSSPGRLARFTSGYATTLLPDGTGMWFFEAGANPARWEMDPVSWARTACRKAGRSLTPAEWEAVTGVSAPVDLSCVPPRR